MEVIQLVRDSGEQIVGHVGDVLAGREAGCLWWCVLLRSSSASFTCLLNVELGGRVLVSRASTTCLLTWSRVWTFCCVKGVDDVLAGVEQGAYAVFMAMGR